MVLGIPAFLSSHTFLGVAVCEFKRLPRSFHKTCSLNVAVSVNRARYEDTGCGARSGDEAYGKLGQR